MTAATVTPYRSAQPAGNDGFAQLVRAEWDKFRSVRGWAIGMVVAALLMLALGLLAVQGGVVCGSSGGPHPKLRTGAACMQAFPTGPGGEAVTDSFYFVRQPLTGNGSVTARVTSLTNVQSPQAPPGLNTGRRPQPWAKAGIIIKASTRQGSAYAAMMVTGSHGVRMQYNFTQDIAGLSGGASPAHPRWLRLTRSGDVITGYDSADGAHWSEVGAVTLAGLPSTVPVGLLAASPVSGTFTTNFGGGTGNFGPTEITGVFDHVSVSGGAHGRSWTGGTVGAPGGFGPNGQGSSLGYQQVAGTFTLTGAGDIAPVVTGPGSGSGGTGTIQEHLIGTFAGLIAVIVVATMFITAEYRRGLIRLTLVASPRRGRVLAAKAVVIGLVTFVMGLVTAAIALVVGVQLSRDQGVYMLPVSGLTTARVVVGTAALLAVGAVLALAVGTILRRSAAAITAVIVGVVLAYVVGVVPGVLPSGADAWLLRLTPAAGFAIQQSVPVYPQVANAYLPPDYYPLGPWAGFAVLCAYAALAMALAVFLLRRRDA
jgi:ABC-type transport system involved in multi-copper enzyme maturation permease subunit/regulation of enolase protein 1 (concanavalin A-like superfamily)